MTYIVKKMAQYGIYCEYLGQLVKIIRDILIIFEATRQSQNSLSRTKRKSTIDLLVRNFHVQRLLLAEDFRIVLLPNDL